MLTILCAHNSTKQCNEVQIFLALFWGWFHLQKKKKTNKNTTLKRQILKQTFNVSTVLLSQHYKDGHRPLPNIYIFLLEKYLLQI